MNSALTTETNLFNRRVFGLPIAIVFVLAYFIFQIVLVTLISNGAGVDDAEQLANISYFDWGYGGSQPPLYTWITTLISIPLGTSLLTLQVVKFGLLASLFISVFYGLRLLGFSVLSASAGMLGMFLVPQLSWESQRALTHSVAGTAACGWTFLAFAWYMQSRKAQAAIAFGFAMGAALLGKFNASFFLIMLLATGLSIQEYRKILLSKLSILTLLSFAACVSPTILWMFANKDSVIARSGKLQLGASGNILIDRLTGAVNLIYASILFSVLVIVIAAIIAFIYRRQKISPTTPISTGEKFMRRLLVVGMIIVLIGIVLSGANNVKDRWMQPILFLTPAVLACLLARYHSTSRTLTDFTAVSCVAALLVPPILSYNLVYGTSVPPYGELDYARLYDEIKSHGEFDTVLTDSVQIPGNFRLFDPSLLVVHHETPNPAAHVNGSLLVMWFGEATPNPMMTNLLEQIQITAPDKDVFTTKIAFKTRPDKEPLQISYFFAKRELLTQ